MGFKQSIWLHNVLKFREMQVDVIVNYYYDAKLYNMYLSFMKVSTEMHHKLTS